MIATDHPKVKYLAYVSGYQSIPIIKHSYGCLWGALSSIYKHNRRVLSKIKKTSREGGPIDQMIPQTKKTLIRTIVSRGY